MMSRTRTIALLLILNFAARTRGLQARLARSQVFVCIGRWGGGTMAHICNAPSAIILRMHAFIYIHTCV